MELNIDSKYDVVIKNNILAFTKSPLSNWFGAFPEQDGGFELFIRLSNKLVPVNCAEQAMMLMKALTFGDWESYEKILVEKSPKEQRLLGRKIKNFDGSKWDWVKYRVVFDILSQKFDQNWFCSKFLVETYPYILVEAAPWDKVWGCGTNSQDERTFDIARWQGQNLLGKILMEVRQDIITKS